MNNKVYIREHCLNLLTIATEFGEMNYNSVFDGMNIRVSVTAIRFNNWYEDYEYTEIVDIPNICEVIQGQSRWPKRYNVNKSAVLRGLRCE